jgi:ferredoxin-type protein NapH
VKLQPGKYLPQLLRRALQLGVLVFVVYAAFGGPWRNYKRAHNQRRLITLMHGETWGYLYGLNEDMLSKLGEPYQASKKFLGMPYASTFFGIQGADPAIAASTLATTGTLPVGLLLQILVPLGLALLLGKVFCSHLCPMRLLFELAQAVRRGLVRLGVELPEVRRSERFGGWVLVGGILASLSASAVVWLYILPYVGLTASVFLYVTSGVVTSLLAVVAIWLTIDLFIAPGFFCHNLCPTGFILENAGRWSLLQLRNRGADPCPTGCDVCERVCPYALSPKHQSHRPACDNCGKCAVACPQRRLARRITLPVITGLALLMLWPRAASAHHIKGLPHYGYFENYPQVPTSEYVEIHGDWEVGATIFNFQGMKRANADTPNDVKIYAYLYQSSRGDSYVGPVVWEIRKGAKVVSRFERKGPDEEAVYSTRETLPGSGNYTLVAMVGGREVASLRFYISLGEDGINWLLIGGIGFPVILVFGLALYGRKQKRKRRRKARPRQSAELGAGA